MKVPELIDESRVKYKKNWKYTSEFYNDKGYYDCLSNRMDSNLRILEIGCGVGYSTISLSKKAKKLIAIDENIFCINSTFQRLNELNITTTKKQRGTINTREGEDVLWYKMDYKNNFPIDENKVHCIEGDILSDKHLISHLESLEKFDVIVCWMIGAHQLILSKEDEQKKGRDNINRTPRMVFSYKVDVLKKVCEIGKNILKKEGYLNIVERVNSNAVSKMAKKEVLNQYKSLLDISNYKMDYENSELMHIETQSKMPMSGEAGILKEPKIDLLIMDLHIVK